MTLPHLIAWFDPVRAKDTVCQSDVSFIADCHFLLVVYLWLSCLMLPNSSFVICKMGTTIPTVQVFY